MVVKISHPKIKEAFCTKECPLIRRQNYAYQNQCSEAIILKQGDGPKILLIGEHPKKENRNPFDDRYSGRLLKTIVSQQAFDNCQVAVTYLLKCSPLELTGNPRNAEDDEIAYCSSNHLVADIKTYKPDVVVLMGKVPARRFFKHEEAMNLIKLRGRIRKDSVGLPGLPVICTYSPTIIHRHSSYACVIRADLMKAFHYACFKDLFDKNKKKVESWEAVTDPVRLTALVDWLEENPNVRIAYDTETTNLLKRNNKMLVFSFSCDGVSGYTVVVDLNPNAVKEVPDDVMMRMTSSQWQSHDLPHIKKQLGRLMTLPNQKIAHNMAFDSSIVMQNLGVNTFDQNTIDTYFYASILDEEFLDSWYLNGEQPIQSWLSLETQVKHWLEYEDPDWYNLKGKRANIEGSMTFNELMYYAAADAILTYRIIFPLEAALYKKSPTNYFMIGNKLLPLFSNLTTNVSFNGLPIDKQLIENLLDPKFKGFSLKKVMDTAKKEWHEHPEVREARRKRKTTATRSSAWDDYIDEERLPDLKINSSGDLSFVYYEHLGALPDNKGKTPVNSAFIKDNMDKYKSLEKLDEYKKVFKLCTTFLPALLNGANLYDDYRVRPTFRVNLVTGRTGCKDPNTQQFPRAEGGARNEFKEWLKRCIKARPGYCVVGIDYKALEVRTAGTVSNDQTMSKMFWNAYNLYQEFLKNPSDETYTAYTLAGDVHRANASMIFNVPVDQVTSAQRSNAKPFSFQCYYSAQPVPLIAGSLGVNQEKAQELLDKYLGTFSGLKAWIENQKAFAKQHGYVETLLGRRRYLYGTFLPERNSMGRSNRAFSHAMNISLNMPVQATGSDFALSGAIGVDNYIKANNIDACLYNLVHDAVYLEIKIDQLDHLYKICEILQRPPLLLELGYPVDFVPMMVDCELGINQADEVTWNGLDNHLQQIKNWLLKGADPEFMPKSPYKLVLP